MYKKYLFSLLLISFIFFVGYWVWFFDLSIISHGDWGFYFTNTQKEFFSFPSLWTPTKFGYAGLDITLYPTYFLFGLLAYVGNFAISERILYLWPTVVIGSFGAYFLVRKILNSHIGGIVGSFVFNYNTYFVLIKTGHLTITTAFSYGLFLFYFYIRALEKKNPKDMTIASILAFVVSFYEFRIFYILVIILIMYALFYYVYIEKIQGFKKFIYNISYAFIPFGVAALGNFYWIYGLSHNASVLSGTIYGRGLFGSDFMNVSRAMTLFHPFWTGTYSLPFLVQPIPHHFWLIPFIAFLGYLLNRKNKYVLFFAILGFLGILLTKQESSPFPRLYIWLYTYFPGFSAFRESSKFYSLISLSYAVLIGGLCAYLWTNYSKKLWGKAVSVSLIFLISLLFLLNLKPFITREIGTLFIPRTVPNEYIQLNKILEQDSYFYRTLAVPYLHRYIYFSSVRPFLDLGATLNPKVLALWNVKYVILPYDSWEDYYKWIAPKSLFDRYISSYVSKQSDGFSIKYDKNFGEIKVWEVDPLPHIYPVKDLIYVDGNLRLPDIVDIPTDRQVAYYTNVIETPTTESKSSNEIIDSFSTQEFAVAQCIRCDLSKKYYDYVKFPYASILPGSPFYGYIESKEKTALSQLTGDSLLSELLFYSVKRIVEITSLAEYKHSNVFIKNTLQANNLLLEQISQHIKTYEKNIDQNEFLLSLYDYILLERRMLTDIAGKNTNEESLKQFENTLGKLDDLVNLISSKVIITRESEKQFSLHVPSDGTYQIYLKKDSGVVFDASPIRIADKNILYEGDFGEYHQFESITLKKGQYGVTYKANVKNYITETNFTIATNTITSQKKKLHLSDLDGEGGQYRIRLAYQIQKGEELPRLYISDPSNQIDPYTGMKGYVYDRTLQKFYDQNWHSHEVYFNIKKGVTEADLNILLPNDRRWNGEPSSINIKDLEIVKIVDPAIILVKKKKSPVSVPNIEYKRINVDHYQVTVKNAKEPFFLSFSEGYSPGWKIYDDILACKIDCNDTAEDITKEYMNTSIQESRYENRTEILPFLKTFDRKSYFDSSHVQINGFGNGWLITKKGNYTLDIMYEPQRYLIIGVFVSIVSGISLLILAYYLVMKGKNK